MTIFTSARMQQAQALYRTLSPTQQYRRSYAYHLVVSPEAAPQREELEQWFSDLPTTKRKRLPKDVTALAPGLVHTYHELAVGAKLKELGFRIEYEPTVRAIRARLGWDPLIRAGEEDTPDWYVEATAQTPAFIVDVFTADIPGQQAVDTAELHKLRGEIAKIPVDAELGIAPPRNDITLPHGLAIQVAGLVKDWLVTENPPPGAHFVLVFPKRTAGDFSGMGDLVGTAYSNDPTHRYREEDAYHRVIFRVGRRGLGLTHINARLGSRPFFVDRTSLWRNIYEKAGKYARTGLPIVVAAVADPMTGISRIEVEAVLLGEPHTDLQVTAQGIQEVQSHESGGFLSSLTQSEDLEASEEWSETKHIGRALSAVVLIERSEAGLWALTEFANPTATTAVGLKSLESLPAYTAK